MVSDRILLAVPLVIEGRGTLWTTSESAGGLITREEWRLDSCVITCTTIQKQASISQHARFLGERIRLRIRSQLC